MTRRVLHVFSRRKLLRLTGAAVVAPLVPACDKLVLPDRISFDSIEPITANAQFYVEHCCGRPEVNPATWSLAVKAEGVELASITADFLSTLEVREREHTLECIGSTPRNRQISNAIWGGLPLLEVLDELGVTVPDTAIEQKWVCADDYHTSLPIEDLERQWLVWFMNGEPMPPIHGAPARVLSPGRYGTKNPKWPVELDFIDTAYTGFWESRGWSNTAEYRPNAFIMGPADMSVLEDGTIEILGTAFAGSDPVTLVEVSTDGGQTWTPAEITYSNGPDIWTLWRFEWKPPRPGVFTVQARMTAESGAMSNPAAKGTGRLNGYDGSMAIELEVV